MDFKIDNIIGKVEDKADWAAFGIGVYERLPDISALMKYFTSRQVLDELKKDTNLQYLWNKLWNSDHLYSTMFKYSVIAYIAGELGILPARYKKIAEKVAWGSGLAGAVSWGHGGSGGSGSGGSGHGFQ